jgi:hypothetical protein
MIPAPLAALNRSAARFNFAQFGHSGFTRTEPTGMPRTAAVPVNEIWARQV